MLLSRLLEDLEVEHLIGEREIDLIGLTLDSRDVKEGMGFVAIKGHTVDGHTYIDSAIAKGAKAVFLNSNSQVDIQEGVTYLYFKDTDLMLADIATAFYQGPSNEMTMIGVTGTNGKTSISLMLETMLKTQNLKTALVGTIENHIGDQIFETQNTTPNALVLNDFFDQAKKTGTTHTIMEVSSHALKLDRVKHVHYDFAIFTNLTEDHLDFHPDFEDYFYSKALLFKRAQKGVIINLEDSFGRRLIDEGCFDVPLWTYGLSDRASIYADHIQYGPSGTQVRIQTPLGSFESFIKIPGDIYVLNTLACVATMVALGFDLSRIQESMAAIKPVRGRLETIENPKGNAIIVDYAHTPDALENVLKVARGFTANKLIAVFGCGGDRDRKKRPIMGEIGYRCADVILVTSDNPRTEDPQAILDDIFEGIPQGSHKEKIVIRQVDRRKAIIEALERMKPGDTVVISGKGHETYQIIGREKHHFDDAEEVRNYFKS